MTDWAEAVARAAGEDAEVSDAYGQVVIDVAPDRWVAVLTAAKDNGLDYFDWLSAVDELDRFRVVVHLADLGRRPLLHLLVRTTVSHDGPHLATATGVFRGASWHERETAEMFGIAFDDHPALDPLLLPDGFEGHPLRKDFVLASRAAKAWPGAKEPGESEEALARGAPARRRMQPPGVPDPTWGPRPPGRTDAAPTPGPEAPAPSGGEP